MKFVREFFQKNFITGLLVLLPIALTYWTVWAVVSWIDNTMRIASWSPFVFPGVGLLTAIILISIVGLVTRNVVGSWVVSWFSRLMNAVPVVGGLYTSLHQIMGSLFQGQKGRFGRAVLIPYPREGSWTIAFVTNENLEMKYAGGKDRVAVYVPTTPNPTSGFLLFVAREEMTPLDISVDEAFRMVISIGIVDDRRNKDNR